MFQQAKVTATHHGACHIPENETMQSINSRADPDRVIDVVSAAMQNDPVARYFQLDAYGLPNSTVINRQQSSRFFHDILEPLYDAGAAFAETKERGGASVW
jgi:hypothetical protein